MSFFTSSLSIYFCFSHEIGDTNDYMSMSCKIIGLIKIGGSNEIDERDILKIYERDESDIKEGLNCHDNNFRFCHKEFRYNFNIINMS